MNPSQDPQKCVLVIEDDPGVCELLKNVLECEYHLSFLHSAVGALHAIKVVRPDVILCAHGLPIMGGYEFARQLCRAPETFAIPVIVMSGWDDGMGEERARRAGAAAFLPKPFLLAELREVIAQHVAEISLTE